MSRLFLFFLLWPLTLAFPGFTTFGTLFVAVLPTKEPQETHIVCSTYALGAKITISKPKNLKRLNAGYEENHFELSRYEVKRNKYKENYMVEARGIYPAFIIKGSNPFTAFVEVFDISDGDAFPLIPKGSCYKSYYITSMPGLLFISVLSFDKKVSVRVTFSMSKKMFKEPCCANVDCKKNFKVTVKLESFQLWYYNWDDENSNLTVHNSLIKSDEPIFVISGNFNCTSPKKNTSSDLCIDAAKPETAWGKEYVVPYLGPNNRTADLSLLFNAVRTPLKVNLLFMPQDKKSSHVNQTIQVNDLQKIFDFTIRDSFIITSKTSFGVALFYESSAGPGELVYLQTALINLVPVEQWTNGAVKTVRGEGMDEYGIDNVYIVSTTPDVSIPKYDNSLQFNFMKGYNSRHTFYWTMLTLKDPPERIFTSEPGGRVMVYLASKPTSSSFTLRPLDFYIGAINNPDCTSSQPAPSDGVDNDCDGTIDEELKNGKDDDGDRRIDEDYILSATYSNWTPWKNITYLCKGMEVTQKRRACQLGPFADICPGKDTVCSPGPECPKGCAQERKDATCESIRDRCDECSQGKCLECKDGFIVSDLCLSPCPQGWQGYRCNEPIPIQVTTLGRPLTIQDNTHGGDYPPRENEKQKKDKQKDKKGQWLSWLWILVPLAAAVVINCIFPLLWLLTRRKTKAKRMAKEEDSDEEEEKNSGEGTDSDEEDLDVDFDEVFAHTESEESPYGEGHSMLYSDFVDPTSMLTKAEDKRKTLAHTLRMNRAKSMMVSRRKTESDYGEESNVD